MKHLLTFSLLFFSLMSSAQDGCLVQPLSAEAIQAYRQNLAAYAPKHSPGDYANKSSANVRIPLQLIIKRKTNGYMPNGMTQEEIEATFLSCLRYVNEELSPKIEFYVVKSDVLTVNDATFGQRLVDRVNPWIENSNPGFISDNSVPIFFGETNFATGEYPFGVAIGSRDLRGRWLLHELGHYFGLLHTYQNAVNGSLIGLLPDGTPTDDYDNEYDGSVYCDDGSDPGLCYGDFISSTEPDVILSSCGLVGNQFAYVRSCDVLVGGVNYTYNIDFFNAMGYWSFGATGLNEEQKQRMYDVITIPELGGITDVSSGNTVGFGGDMSFLFDDDEPENTFVPPTLEYFRQSAPFKMAHFTDGQPTELRDYFQGKVRLKYNGATNVDGHERPYIGDGVLKTDRFIPLGTEGETVQYDFSDPSEDCEPLRIYRPEIHVKTSDLVFIINHILGREEFQDPYKKIAADVTNNGEIDVRDVVRASRFILGIDNSLPVPYYRFVPKYPLTDETGFAEAFNADPFSATWSYNGQDYAYLPSETEESYLGSTKPDQTLPNTLSFPLSLTDPRVQDADAVTFHAVRSGDVLMNTQRPPAMCETPVKENILNEGIILEAGKLNKVTIQLNNTGKILGMRLKLMIKPESNGEIVKVFNELVSSGSIKVQESAQTTAPAETLFAGMTSAKSDELDMILVSSDKTGGSSYVEFYVGGLVKDMPITQVLELDCVASELYSPTSKERIPLGKQASSSPVAAVAVAVEQDLSNESETTVVVSPNPVRETLRLDLAGNVQNKVRQVSIFNLNGKVIRVNKASGAPRQMIIPVSELLPGFYIISVSLNDGTQVASKFIKE